MSRLINNKWFILGLVMLALYYVLHQLSPYFGDEIAVSSDSTIIAAEPAATAYTAERFPAEHSPALQSPSRPNSGGEVAINQLVWNNAPMRDPFSEFNAISKPATTSQSTTIVVTMPTNKKIQASSAVTSQPSADAIPQLTGFVVANTTKFAILNGQITSVGQLINDYKVLAIDSTTVSLHQLTSTKTIILSLE